MTTAKTTTMVRPSDNGSDPVKALQRYLEPRTKALAKFAASRIKPETLIRLAIFEFSQSDFLRRCSPESIYASLILSAQVGLEPGGIRGEAYLVPYKGKCTLIPGWRGLVKLALRSKAVKSFYSHVVFSNDQFTVHLGSEPRVEHRPALENRGEIIAAYAVARMENSEIDVEVMGIDDLQKIKDNAARSRGGNPGPAYGEWEDQMFRKAPIRRLSKRLPLGDDFFLAAKADELAETGEPEKIQSFIDVDGEYSEHGNTTTDAIAGKLAERAAQARDESA